MQQVTQLKRGVADKTLDVDVFKGALKKSRLDAGAEATLPRRISEQLREVDARARQPEDRADVSVG